MKRMLYTFSLGLATVAALTLPAAAQEKRSGKLGEYDEIVIKRKGALRDAKVTVEIKDGEVLVDGKKIDEFKDGNIIVQRRIIVPRDGNMPQRGGIQLLDEQESDVNIAAPAAVLGVMTKKEAATGATVVEVAPGTPAEKAGLKEGDIITKVNDKKINEPQDLFETIGSMKPGDKVTVTYLRDKKESKTSLIWINEIHYIFIYFTKL